MRHHTFFRYRGLARTCPLCGSEVGGVAIWHEDDYDYVRCRRCGTSFSNISAERYEAARHNAWDEEPDWEALAFYGAARERAHREFLATCPPFGGQRLLDVGCGMGFFLERAAATGWDVRGIDASPSWARVASERVGNGRVVLGRLEIAPLEEASFDLVTAWDVIEHIHEPAPFLRRLRKLVTPNGRVFVRTPNFAYVYPVYALRRTLLRHKVELGPTNHVVYFTSRTLRRALEDSGLRPVEWPVFAPPQVPVAAESVRRFSRQESFSVRCKNLWAHFANTVAKRSRGRVCVGSDLDVICRRA